MNILFCQPFVVGSRIVNRIGYGAYSIQAYLSKQGYGVKCFKKKGRFSLNSYVNELVKQNVELFAFSIYDDNVGLVKAVIEGVVSLKPEIKVILGGPSVTASSVKALFSNIKRVNYILEGEGEKNFKLLLDFLSGGKSGSLDRIPNLHYRQDDVIISNPTDRQLADINDFPSPILEGQIEACEAQMIGLFSSRGCFHRCIYCNFSIQNKYRLRFYNIERFIEELKYLQYSLRNTMYNYIPIWDDAITLDMNRAKKIFNTIVNNKIKVKLWCQARADYLDKEMLYIMKKAGVVGINVGLESGSPRVLKVIKKVRLKEFDNVDLEPEQAFLKKVSEARKYANEIGLAFSTSIIVGLPSETPSDAYETIKYLIKLNPDYYSHNLLKLYTGTELTKNYYNYGYRILNAFDSFSPMGVTHIKYPYDVSIIPSLPTKMSPQELVLLTGLNISELNKEQGNSSQCITLIESDLDSGKYNQNYRFDQFYIYSDDKFKLSNESDLRSITIRASPVFIDSSSKSCLKCHVINYSKLNETLNNLVEYYRQPSCQLSELCGTYLLIDFETNDDYVKLSNDYENTLNGDELLLPQHMSNLPYAGLKLLDSCRWGNRCPAMDNERIFIQNKLKKTCLEGNVIKFNKRDKSTTHECNTCQYELNCSKCSKAKASGQHIYCMIRQRGYNVLMYFNLWSQIFINHANPLRGRIKKNIVNSIIIDSKNTKVDMSKYNALVQYDNKYFCYRKDVTSMETRIIKIDLPTYKTLIRIYKGENINIIRNWLVSNYCITFKEAANYYSMVLNNYQIHIN